MEKHSAYCAMMRLGLKVPETWLIPNKLPPDNPRYMPMAELYNPDFDLEAIAEQIGYPLYMKPFNGGTWVGVTRIANVDELRRSYDESGERLMHLQAAVEDYEVFTRTLSVGPQTLVVRFDPGQHGHYRYVVDHEFLAPELEREVATISRLVNAFFRWELNSCEVIVKDDQAQPIDYANASPDMALVSLHYYFPWAIKSLTAWCIFCTVTRRSMRINQNTRDYFEIGDRADLVYEEKLERYGQLANAYFQAEEFEDFRTTVLPHLDELMVEYVGHPEFDDLLVQSIRLEVEPERQEEMIDRCREPANCARIRRRSTVVRPLADEKAGHPRERRNRCRQGVRSHGGRGLPDEMGHRRPAKEVSPKSTSLLKQRDASQRTARAQTASVPSPKRRERAA